MSASGDTFYGQWCGPYYQDSVTKITDISDGTSNTFGYGEIMGGSETAPRDFLASWMGAGALPTAWDTITPAQWYSFGSKHTNIVHFGYCDGSVRREVVSPVDIHRIDRRLLGELDEIDHARRLRPHLVEVLFAQDDVATLLEFVAFDDLRVGNLTVAMRAPALLLNACAALAVQLIERDRPARLGGREHFDGDVHQRDLQKPFPRCACSHSSQ